MSISRSEIFRKKKRKRGTEVEKIIGDHKRSMGCHGRLMGGQRASLGVKFSGKKKEKKRGTEVEKIIEDHKKSMRCHGRLMGGQRGVLDCQKQ